LPDQSFVPTTMESNTYITFKNSNLLVVVWDHIIKVGMYFSKLKLVYKYCIILDQHFLFSGEVLSCNFILRKIILNYKIKQKRNRCWLLEYFE
jgi:hypothetical protein